MATMYNGTTGSDTTVHSVKNLDPVCGAREFGGMVWSTEKPVTCIKCATTAERAGYMIAFVDALYTRDTVAAFDKLASVQIFASAYVTLRDGVRWIKFGREADAIKFGKRVAALPGVGNERVYIEYGKIKDVI